jgi:hypothetical protein
MFGDNDQPIRKHAPKWCVRKCGATFGFGGVLIKFSTSMPTPQNAAPGAQKPSSAFNPEVTLCEYVSDRPLVYKSRAFQTEIQKAEAKVCMYVCMCECLLFLFVILRCDPLSVG